MLVFILIFKICILNIFESQLAYLLRVLVVVLLLQRTRDRSQVKIAKNLYFCEKYLFSSVIFLRIFGCFTNILQHW